MKNLCLAISFIYLVVAFNKEAFGVCLPDGNQSTSVCHQHVTKNLTQCKEEATSELRNLETGADTYQQRQHYLYLINGGCAVAHNISTQCNTCPHL